MQESPNVVIVRQPDDEIANSNPVSWAVQRLEDALSKHGLSMSVVSAADDAAAGASIVVALGNAVSDSIVSDTGFTGSAESFAAVPATDDGRSVVSIVAADARGMSYGITELADRVVYSKDVQSALRLESQIVEEPANPLRGIMRLFTSDVEDKSWFYDRDFWTRYLDEVATHRFNRFHLAFGIGYDFLREVSDVYFVFAYPYFISVPGYNVRVSDLSAVERARNLETLKFIGEEVRRRGMDFQLGLWTQQYEWTESPDPDQIILGLDAESHPRYCRDALQMLLQEVPSITGVTLRVHGESGIPEGNNHLWKIILDGIANCGRKVEIDLHPKGVDHEMIKIALDTGMPTAVSPKYIAEHMGIPAHQAAIRPCEQETANTDHDGFIANLMNLSHGELRFTRYSYANFLSEDRTFDVIYRIWPGTQRLLVWGSPAFAAGLGRFGTFGGSRGIEIFEPLSFKGRRGSGLPGGRDAYADDTLKPSNGDFEKYEYTYRICGRYLYNPDTESDVLDRYLTSEFGHAGLPLGKALANASEILPLVTSAHLPSAANNRYWPEIYTNMPIVDPENRFHPYVDTVLPAKFSTVSPGDAEMFLSIEQFVDEVLNDNNSGRYSPLTAANWLEQRANEAGSALGEASHLIADEESPAYRRMAIDIAIQIELGRFFAEKLRAGVGFTIFEHIGSVRMLQNAVDHYRSARDAWRRVIEHGSVYRDDITVGERPFLRGHWKDRLEAIELDVSDMETKLQEARSAEIDPEHATIAGKSLEQIDERLAGISCSHQPPDLFTRGNAIPLSLAIDVARGEGAPLHVELRYRRVNQAESAYKVTPMEQSNGAYHTEIPGDFTDTSFPVMYYFAIRDASGHSCLCPGLDKSRANQPYYVVHQW